MSASHVSRALGTASLSRCFRPVTTFRAARPLTAINQAISLRSFSVSVPVATSPTSPLRAPASPQVGGNRNAIHEFDLNGKVILISGAGQGLGLAQAEALLESGATVYALDRLAEPSEGFNGVASRAKENLGRHLHYRSVDVRDTQNLDRITKEIADEEGRMDGLIAAAGIQHEHPAIDYPPDKANEIFSINITGLFMTAKSVANQMIRLGKGGSICAIASMSGTVANRDLPCAAYNASKAGVLQLSRNLAAEWGQYGIRVNTISPGYIVTEMTAGLFKRYPDRRETWPKANMLNKLSGPEDYRGAAVFLMSDASGFMTGADLRIDGGHSAW